jgi:hypothetical protein
MACKNKSVLSVYALVVLKFCFLLASSKTLTNFFILPVTLFKELVAAFRNPPVKV